MKKSASASGLWRDEVFLGAREGKDPVRRLRRRKIARRLRFGRLPGLANYQGRLITKLLEARELSLALGFLALGAALANFVARVALANHVDSTASTNDLAIWVTEFQGTD